MSKDERRIDKTKKKPPVGLRPKYMVDIDRGLEICDAMKRYISDKRTIPKEWLNEIGDLFNESR